MADQAFKFLDLGTTALLIILVIYAVKVLYPQLLKDKKAERENESSIEAKRLEVFAEMAGRYGGRLAAASENQAKGICALADSQVKSEMVLQEKFAGLEMAICQVDTRMSAQGNKFTQIEKAINDMAGKVDLSAALQMQLKQYLENANK